VRFARPGRRGISRTPPAALVGIGALSVQFGAALATKLFHHVGPAGAAMVRLAFAAVVLALISVFARGRRKVGRPGHRDLAVAVAFGLVLAGMNLSFYEALARIPLGVAVTVEFSGPLVLALIGSRRWVHGLWALLAGAGVVLLGSGIGHGIDAAGLGLALLAGGFWIGYILLAKQTGQRFDALSGLAVAMAAGAVVMLPVGLVAGGSQLFTPYVLIVGLTVAVLSSVVPYSVELIALRRVTARAFGVMLSLDPAVAAAVGLLVLSQHLTGREWLALALVIAANLGNSLVGQPAAGVQEPGSSVAV
jgi:inner membrane transporter RhtA